MDKQNVIYTYNGILFSLEKEHATTNITERKNQRLLRTEALRKERIVSETNVRRVR